MADMLNRKALLSSLGGDAEDDPMGPLPLEPTTPGPMSAEPGGITGAEPAAPSPPPMAAAPTRDFSRLTGYDQGKFDANKDDAKYQMGGVLSGFDPSKGFDDPAVADALDKLGYGDFSGHGDRLSLSGLTDKGRAAKLKGDYSGADFITKFSGEGADPHWAYADPVEEARLAAEQGGGGGGVPGLPGQIAGDPMAMIQQALSHYASSPNIQALLAQLGGA